MQTAATANGDIVNDLESPDKQPATQQPTAQPAASGGLADITTAKVRKPRLCLIYGVHGIGKSTFAAQAPSPIIVPTEEGVNDIEVAKFPLCKSFTEVTGRLATLASEDHKFQTVVIDSLDWLETLIHKEVCRDKGVQSIDEIPYAKGYVHAMGWWNDILKALTYLRDSKRMGVVLVAHAQVAKFESPETDNYDRYTPKLNKHAAARVCEWCDEVLFAGYQVFTKSTDEGFGRTSTKALGGDQRVIRANEKPYCVAKNRLGMPDELPLAWSSYAEHYSK